MIGSSTCTNPLIFNLIMKRKKIFKIALALIILAVVIGGGYAFYLFNMPHRDIQSTETDYVLQATALTNEYLKNPDQANEKYLDDEGESKIIEVSGIVNNISEDFKGNKVVLLKSENDEAGVSCTFTTETNQDAAALKIGEQVTIKGVIRSGAYYDEDLGMYENVIMEKCAIK